MLYICFKNTYFDHGNNCYFKINRKRFKYFRQIALGSHYFWSFELAPAAILWSGYPGVGGWSLENGKKLRKMLEKLRLKKDFGGENHSQKPKGF